MPEKELWPAGPGSEPVTPIGSCDSMMSATSSRSGSTDSYDFLSAEEKECLLFLEETIGSLDAEADSGLSTDESEPASTPRGFRPLPVTQLTPQGKPEEALTQQGAEPQRVALSSSSRPPEPLGPGLRSGSHSLPRNIHIGRNQSLKKSPAQTNGHFPRTEPGKEQTSQGSEPGQVLACPQGAALDLDGVLIPPPEAFQDTQPEQARKHSLPKGPGGQNHTPPVSTSSQKRQESSEAMSQTASGKDSSAGPGQPPRPPSAQSSQNAPSGGDLHAGPAPLTAPKPRKLPPNIVLKSSRSSFHSQPQHWLSRHTETGDASAVASSLQEQRKARREALEKLGLPQDQDELGPRDSKTTTPGSLRLKEALRPGQASGPAQPAAPAPIPPAAAAGGKAPASALGPSPMKSAGWGSLPSKAPPQEPAQGKMAAANSVPIPIPATPKTHSPLLPSKRDSGLTLQESSIPGLRQMSFKSNTLERSGVGLSGYLSAEKDPSPPTSKSLGKDSFLDKTSPSVLRNSRPRPASLGTGKDFAGIPVGKLGDLEQGQNSKRLSYQGQSRDKLPRPPCVSVKISPKGIHDPHRREALKKLGLLKE
ncbi:specifically androgen-regulated gene protein [Perognathus longimembris pacificus]|uniref:specifically androgen-regulated gene protein n=1 Tax=Perognathus longimembris pacificus TaxID=214514 RepID=UPI002019447B|nr:specifically androgen-regulated gene protein [Perognathus longimembris pacificus]